MQESTKADAPNPTSNVHEVSAKFQMILDAGAEAPQAWNALTVAEQDEILTELFPELTAAGKRPQLMGVVVTLAQTSITSTRPLQPHDPSPNWCTGYYVVDTGGRPAGKADGPAVEGDCGPTGATLSMSQQGSVSNTFQANVGVNAQVVSAGVGFNVTQSWSVTYGYSVQVPPNKTYRIQSFHHYNGVDFNVWDDDCGDPADTLVGSGTAWSFNGTISYTVWEI